MTRPIGLLMLDSQFPRIPGDMGNPATWDIPMIWKTVDAALPSRIVADDPREFLEKFIEAGHQLVADGACGITTSCGFLSLYQDDMRAALDVPVATSSLMQVPMINATLPHGRHCGILTISETHLSPAHLAAARVPDGTPVGGVDPSSEFARKILGNATTLDTVQACEDCVSAAQELCAKDPDIGALVLECTNMTPYAAEIAQTCRRPVYTIVNFITWFHAGICPRTFSEV